MNDHCENPHKKSNAIQEAVRGVNAGRDVTIDNITQTYNLSQWTPQEKNFRVRLLNTVHKYWFYRLDEKLSSKAEIELALKTRPDFEENPFSHRHDKVERPTSNTNIETIFDQWKEGQRLLILGHPGAGKTVALQQLGKKICEWAREDILGRPIPVVFHLSSWKDKQPIDDWLVQQLKAEYGFPAERALDWVRNRSLFLLLDGLDEVETKHQQACVRKINQFGASNIAVCSRIQQYQALSKDTRLRIDLAVYIKPLASAQINQYLEQVNRLELGKELDKDKTLKRLAKIPFWLDIMTDLEELPRKGSSQEYKGKLFDKFIEKKLNKSDEIQ